MQTYNLSFSFRKTCILGCYQMIYHVNNHLIFYNIKYSLNIRDNITIFGESAGSFSVDVLIRSDLAVPYFHRAIGQSGLLISTWCAQTKEKLFSS